MLTQILVFLLFGMEASFADNLALGSIFAGISIARSYLLRRLFKAAKLNHLSA